MNSDDEADKFIKTYLREASKFHAEKADYLAQVKDKINNETNYEKVQAEVLKNPDDDIRNLFKTKVQIDKALNHSSGAKAEYLAYEKEYAEDIIKKTAGSAAGSARWTIDPGNEINKSYKNIPSDVRDKFEAITGEFEQIPPDSPVFGDEALKLKAVYAKILETNNI